MKTQTFLTTSKTDCWNHQNDQVKQMTSFFSTLMTFLATLTLKLLGEPLQTKHFVAHPSVRSHIFLLSRLMESVLVFEKTACAHMRFCFINFQFFVKLLIAWWDFHGSNEGRSRQGKPRLYFLSYSNSIVASMIMLKNSKNFSYTITYLVYYYVYYVFSWLSCWT